MTTFTEGGSSRIDWRFVLAAGVVAGLLDGVAAVIQAWLVRGTDAVTVFQFIASGALGRAAFDGGLPAAMLGLLFHLCIATSWASVYALARRQWTFLRRPGVPVVVGFGLVIWTVMNLIVLPLSRIPSRAFSASQASVAAAILIVMVSWPIVAILHRFDRNSR